MNFKELPILDYTVLKYESKGIFTTIEKLWKIENYIIAIAIALFSIILPLIKTIAMYICLYYETNIKYLDKLGKWSMADVFVISILLSILSLNTDEFTKAEPKIAIYFFGTYVVLNILSSILIHKKSLSKD